MGRVRTIQTPLVRVDHWLQMERMLQSISRLLKHTLPQDARFQRMARCSVSRTVTAACTYGTFGTPKSVFIWLLVTFCVLVGCCSKHHQRTAPVCIAQGGARDLADQPCRSHHGRGGRACHTAHRGMYALHMHENSVGIEYSLCCAQGIAATASVDGSLRFWNLLTPSASTTAAHNALVSLLTPIPEPAPRARAPSARVGLLASSPALQRAVAAGQRVAFSCIAVSPDGMHVAAGMRGYACPSPCT